MWEALSERRLAVSPNRGPEVAAGDSGSHVPVAVAVLCSIETPACEATRHNLIRICQK